MPLQSLIRAVYPPQCVMCDVQTEDDFALCGSCWAETPFISGLFCDACGAPLPGEGVPNPDVLCDDCMTIARPWSKGRAALVYKDKARRLVLSIKHGDRTDLVRAVGPWMARSAQDILLPDALLVPVPLHRFRLLRRKFNQASLLAQRISDLTGLACCPDALIRPKKTKPLEGYGRDQRFTVMDQAILASPKRIDVLTERRVIIVDDVMTSGATFAAAASACLAAGAKDVSVLALARVVKDA